MFQKFKKNILIYVHLFIFLNVFITPIEAKVVINEILPNPQGGGSEADEFIELYNDSDETINLDGWQLVDMGGKKYKFNDSVSLSPHGFVVFKRSETKIALNNNNDTIRLLNQEDIQQDIYAYEKTYEGQSFGRYPDSVGEWFLLVAQSPGSKNSLPLPTNTPLPSPTTKPTSTPKPTTTPKPTLTSKLTRAPTTVKDSNSETASAPYSSDNQVAADKSSEKQKIQTNEDDINNLLNNQLILGDQTESSIPAIYDMATEDASFEVHVASSESEIGSKKILTTILLLFSATCIFILIIYYISKIKRKNNS